MGAADEVHFICDMPSHAAGLRTKALAGIADGADGLIVKAHIERSDVCAVPAASIVGEAALALILADALLEKLGGDSIEELEESYARLRER